MIRKFWLVFFQLVPFYRLTGGWFMMIIENLTLNKFCWHQSRFTRTTKRFRVTRERDIRQKTCHIYNGAACEGSCLWKKTKKTSKRTPLWMSQDPRSRLFCQKILWIFSYFANSSFDELEHVLHKSVHRKKKANSRKFLENDQVYINNVAGRQQIIWKIT